MNQVSADQSKIINYKPNSFTRLIRTASLYPRGLV